MEKLTGLWKRQGKNSEYLSGTLNKSDLQKLIDIDGDIIVMVFQSKKKSDKQPDFEIFYDKKKSFAKPTQYKAPTEDKEWGFIPSSAAANSLFPVATYEAASMHVPEFGKYKNRALGSIPVGELISYCEWMKGECYKSGKPMHEKAKKLVQMSEILMNNPVEPIDSESEFNDNDLPF